MSHKDKRRGIKAVYKQANLLVDVQVEGAAHSLHALPAQPALGSAEQGGHHLVVLLGLEHAEVTRAIGVLGQVHLIDLRSDTTHGSTLPVSDPTLPTRVFEKVVAGREALTLHEIPGGDPGRICGVKSVWQSHEITQSATPGHHLQRERGAPGFTLGFHPATPPLIAAEQYTGDTSKLEST
jgi:hypothetical protein